jgi:hypothetical protein
MMVWHGALVRAVVHRAGEEATEAAALAVLEDANPHVPFMDGDLRDSGRVTQGQSRVGPTGLFDRNEHFVTYDTDYAVRLHEHPEYNFQGQGEGKWLERALQRRASRIEVDMAPPLRAAFLLP